MSRKDSSQGEEKLEILKEVKIHGLKENGETTLLISNMTALQKLQKQVFEDYSLSLFPILLDLFPKDLASLIHSYLLDLTIDAINQCNFSSSHLAFNLLIQFKYPFRFQLLEGLAKNSFRALDYQDNKRYERLYIHNLCNFLKKSHPQLKELNIHIRVAKNPIDPSLEAIDRLEELLKCLRLQTLQLVLPNGIRFLHVNKLLATIINNPTLESLTTNVMQMDTDKETISIVIVSIVRHRSLHTFIWGGIDTLDGGNIFNFLVCGLLNCRFYNFSIEDLAFGTNLVKYKLKANTAVRDIQDRNQRIYNCSKQYGWWTGYDQPPTNLPIQMQKKTTFYNGRPSHSIIQLIRVLVIAYSIFFYEPFFDNWAYDFISKISKLLEVDNFKFSSVRQAAEDTLKAYSEIKKEKDTNVTSMIHSLNQLISHLKSEEKTEFASSYGLTI